jgi:energy-coupling factor transporter ATP-binding protein EcfA2
MNRSEIETLVQAFMDVTVKHTLQDQAHEAIAFACSDNPSASIIVLAGPTGVGKSTLLSKFADEYLRQRAPEMATDPTLRPIAYSIAVASGHRGFDWKRLFKDAGANLADPFAYQRNRGGPRKGAGPRRPLLRLAGEGVGAAVMREELEAELRLRGSGIWIIDEAQHVIRGGRTGAPGDQLDVLKSLGQTSSTKLLLCGTYDLPDYMVGSGQLSRRNSVIRLNRYRWTELGERRVFANVVNALLKRLPERTKYPDVKANLQFFYVHTLGCVGILKEWVARALAKQLTLGDSALTIEHFRLTRLTANQLAAINQEVIDGEARYGEGSDEPDDVLKRSILRGVTVFKQRSRNATEPARACARVRQPRHVGERTPGRDLVGRQSPCDQ